MKTIGFIDYFIDEWHANEYPNFIANYNSKYGEDFAVKYAWAEIDNPNGITTEEWCKKYGAEKCSTIAELCEKADYVIVLAPSNPETHLKYAEEVFKCGCSPYIDKTFAPDYKTAKKIYELSEKYGVKFFSSSALRYADEIKGFDGDADTVLTVGGGASVDEYIIHQIEMVVKCLGVGANEVRYDKKGRQEWMEIRYDNGKSASMMLVDWIPFALVVGKTGERSELINVNSAFFDNLIADIMNFFKTGDISFDKEQTLEVMKIREAVIRAKAEAGKWVKA